MVAATKNEPPNGGFFTPEEFAPEQGQAPGYAPHGQMQPLPDGNTGL